MPHDKLEARIRRFANAYGVDVQRYRPWQTEQGRLAAMLAAHDVDLVLDIGANTGQFASQIRAAGYAGRIVSFEPLREAHSKLLKNSAADKSWQVPPPVAIGDRQGEVDLHVAGNSVSSSVLPMLQSHAKAAPASSYIALERVRVNLLDSEAWPHLAEGSNVFLKIDTQGYEDRVLRGATEILSRAVGIQLELSLVPLYEGQKLFGELLNSLQQMGFSIWAIRPGFCDAATGRMLQVDAVLFRT